MPTYAIMRTKI